MKRLMAAAVVVCAVSALSAPLCGDEPQSAAPDELLVLDGGTSLWRSFVVWGRPLILTAEGELRPLKRQRYHWMSAEDPEGEPVAELEREPPPDAWLSPDFDDRDWAQGHCPLGPSYQPRDWRGPGYTMWSSGSPAQVATLHARGKFRVADPANAADLRLRARFHGGVVVYLNGTEIKRGHLPDGDIALDTPAEPYADDVYLDEEGELIVGAPNDRTTDEQREQFEQRVRTVEVEIDPALLRAGVNVIAIEVHRAPYRDVYREPREHRGTEFQIWPHPWAHCRLLDVTLTAAPDAAVEPNAGRPKGIQLWTPHRWTTVTGHLYGDRCEAPAPIRLIAARNGEFTARLVVSSPEPITGMKVEVSDLAGPDETLPASAVRVRYPQPDGARFDALLTDPAGDVPVRDFQAGRQAPVSTAAMQPIWLTVAVPEVTLPGTYEGTVKVTAEGLDASVPIIIEVHGWRLPDPADLAAHNNLWQSHETVAYRYDVPLWSDRHFELMGEGLALTAPLGNKFCLIPMIAPSFAFGNTQSMVRWVRQDDGYTWDFSVFDRYLDLYGEVLGKPDVLVIDVSHAIHSRERPEDGSVVAKVSVLDPETGEIETMEQALKGENELVEFWRPVLTEVKARLEERGWWEVTRIGTASDSGPLPDEANAFKTIWPDRGWLFSGHPNKDWVGDEIAPVTCIEWVWGVGRIWEPGPDSTGRDYPAPWTKDKIDLAFPRAGAGATLLRQAYPLEDYRLNPEKTLQCGRHGIGRIAMDLWRFEYEPNRWRQLGVAGGQFSFNAGVAWMLAPGPDGPVPTTRSEMFREGIQIREAITFLRKALENDGLEPALAEQAGELIVQRARDMLRADGHRTWREQERRLFALCAEVATALELD